MLIYRQWPWLYMWHFIVSANVIPDDCDPVVAVWDGDGFHPLEFPCRWKDGCWINAKTGRLVEVQPTHWRYWES